MVYLHMSEQVSNVLYAHGGNTINKTLIQIFGSTKSGCGVAHASR